MKYQLSIAALVATIVSAGVIAKRAITDGKSQVFCSSHLSLSNKPLVEILNYALTLEHLEDKFYREGLANYTHQDFLDAGFADPFYKNLKEVSFDETTHVTFLSGALGADAVAECTYQFPSTDVKSFVGLAQVLVRPLCPSIQVAATNKTRKT